MQFSNKYTRYTVEELMPAFEPLGLRRNGSDFKGPCPVCSGTDRFSISQGKDGYAWLYCRKGCDQGNIIKTLRELGHLPESNRKPIPYTPNLETNTQQDARRVQNAQAAWSNGAPFNGVHPYLQKKGLTLQHLESFRQAHSLQISRYAAGLKELCLMFPLSAGGEIRALQAIDENGTKRTIGAPKGATFRYGIPVPGAPIVIGEGLATVASVANGLFGCGYVTVGDWNIDPVVSRIKALHQGENGEVPEFIILGDIDKNGCINQKALKAAATHGIKLAEARHV